MSEQARGGGPEFVSRVPEPQRHEVLTGALLRGAAALRESGVPFMLCGSLACWARGGPEPFTKDVDFCVRPDDADRALQALDDAGMTVERPPEGWLYKAWDDGILIDLLFCPANVPVTDKAFEHADELLVMSVPMKVAAIDDIVSTKLLALNEDSIDFKQLLQIARALREQIGWAAVRSRTESSPYAVAFFTLVEQLGVVDADELAGAGEVPVRELPAPLPEHLDAPQDP